MPAPKEKALTPKERQFAAEYLKDRNGTQAYLRAFPGAKPNSARVQATRLLAKPALRALVDAHLKAQEERAILTADDVLRAIKRTMDFDPAKAFDAKTGRPLDVHEMPEELRLALQGFEYEEEYSPGYTPKDLRRLERKLELDGEVPTLREVLEHQAIGRTVKLRFPDRNAAIKNAIDVLGMRAADKHEVDVGPTLADILARSFELKDDK